MPRRVKSPTFTSASSPDFTAAAELLATTFHQALARRKELSEEILCEKQPFTCGQVKTATTYQ